MLREMKTYATHNFIRSRYASSIASFDNRGRVTNVTSYDATSGGSVIKEVKYTFADNNWGQITEIQQNNTTSVGSSGTREIDYAYDDGNVSGAAKYLRRTSVT